MVKLKVEKISIMWRRIMETVAFVKIANYGFPRSGRVW